MTIRVGRAGRVYTVRIEPRALSRLGALLDADGLRGRRLLVSTPRVWGLHGRALPAAFRRHDPILVPDGERFKRLGTVQRLYDALIAAGADRATILVALGGGVLGDVAGLAAATFLRGIRLVHVPTTLLAQVDSAIGGKVGVNHALGKNLIGAFHPPAGVVVDPRLLDTLASREFRSGLYEVVKYALIASRRLFARLDDRLTAVLDRDPAELAAVIARCCRIKARLVTLDEREQGPRRVLNLGHTAGHALESVTGYRRFRHGEAVAYGLLVACHLAATRGAMPAAERDAVAGLIARLGPLPRVSDLSARDVAQAVRRDKKVIAGRLHFVMPRRIGICEQVTDVGERELTVALRVVGLGP